MKKLLLAFALLCTSPALAVDPYTSVGNAAYTILSTDIRLVPIVALSTNRTWTLPSAGATCVGQTCGSSTIEIIDAQGNVGGSNSCIVLAPASGETINGGSGSFTFCSTFGRLAAFPMTGTNWSVTAIGASGQVVGTATNDNACAGCVGEVITSTIAAGSAVSITTATPINITSVSLTAGDWDCRAVLSRTFTATTSYTILTGSISTTTGTIGSPAAGTQVVLASAANVPGQTLGPSSVLSPVRESLSATTTVYLVASDTFTASTDAGYGTLACRRAR